MPFMTRFKGERIVTDIQGRYTDHFKEWSRLYIAVHYIESEMILGSIFVRSQYQKTTGRDPDLPLRVAIEGWGRRIY